MFDRRNIRRIYLNITGKTKDFLLSDKSREFFVFLFFFFIAGGFWLLQTLNNDYEAEFSIPVRLRGVPNNTMITSEPVSELHIKVKDKGTVLLNYMLGKSFYPVSLDFSDYKAVDNHVRIYASQFEKKVLSQLNVSTRLLSMKPDTLESFMQRECPNWCLSDYRGQWVPAVNIICRIRFLNRTRFWLMHRKGYWIR